MKEKKLLPLPMAVAAAVATMSAAHAQMFIDDQNTGEVVVLPFYSAENGNSTNVNIANTTGLSKAVKVRIIEGENSQEVLDWNLYMSPYDHFSFAIVATDAGGGAIMTNDTSCTVPAITGTVPFRSSLYDDPEGADCEADNCGIERTATGYIEIIEMGQIEPDTATDVAVTHVDGVPADCDLVVEHWSNIAGVVGPWLEESSDATRQGETHMLDTWNGGGLYAYAGVVNAADATAYGVNGTAISSAVTGTGYALHFPPGNTEPDFTHFADVNANGGFIDDATVTVDGIQTDYMNLGDSLDAVSAVFMTSQLMNDYVTDPDILATTDWVITMPTKFLHINTLTVPEREPFTIGWNGAVACEYVALKAWDREEGEINTPPGSTGPDFSPAPEIPDIVTYDLPLCYEVNVLRFADESAVKNESLAIGDLADDYLPGVDGWAKIDFEKSALTADSQDIITNDRLIADLSGLPVLGFAVQTYGNDNLNDSGSVANYAMSVAHKTKTTTSTAQ